MYDLSDITELSLFECVAIHMASLKAKISPDDVKM